MIPRPVYILPGQAVIFEQGPTQGNPLANAVITSGWFDVFQVQPGQLVAPQTAALVDGTSEAITGIGTTANVAAYQLDLFTEHNNASGLSYTLDVEANIAQALGSGAAVYRLASLIVPTQDPGTGETRAYTHRVPVTARFVRIKATYPNVNSTRFHLSAVLRAC